MFHDLLQWLQDVPGATDGDPFTSWSQQFAGSLHLWALTEGTHLVSLMLFAGTILMVDLRMLGLAFRNVPYSTLNNRVLPLTVAGFVLVMATGALLFFSNPVHYYHSVFFRAKVIFIILAAVNIFWFHSRTQKSQTEWDAQPSPPVAVKVAAGVSVASWVLVIVFGRLMALTFFECENMKPGTFGYVFAECDVVMRDAIAAEEAGEADATPMEEPAAEESAEPATPEQPSNEPKE
ncbi:MAG TPA: DUF6644 family protein [Hyphomonadaceae bacterium]|nr:DUF6644 family protein [Hyphomonadaceae bacterium]